MSFTGDSPKFKRVKLTEQAADPSNPIKGDLFESNGTPRANGLWRYNGTDWVRVDSANSNLAVRALATGATLDIADEFITADSSGGTFIIALPTAVGNEGKNYTVKKIDTSFTAVTIDPDGSETIDGNSTTTVNTNGESLQFISDNVNWLIIRRDIPTIETTFTPSWSNLTIGNGTENWRYQRVGNLLHIHGNTTFGSTSSISGDVSFTNPITGTTMTQVSGMPNNGYAHLFDSSTPGNCQAGLAGIATGAVRILGEAGCASLSSTVPFTWATSDRLGMDAWFKIDEWNG